MAGEKRPREEPTQEPAEEHAFQGPLLLCVELLRYGAISTARLVPWTHASRDIPSSSQPSVTQAVLPSGPPSSPFDGEEPRDEGGDILTVVRQLDVTNQALRDECREAERLRAYLSAAEIVLGAADEETAMARAMATAAQAELAAIEGQLAAAQAEAADLCRANEDLAQQLAEVARL